MLIKALLLDEYRNQIEPRTAFLNSSEICNVLPISTLYICYVYIGPYLSLRCKNNSTRSCTIKEGCQNVQVR